MGAEEANRFHQIENQCRVGRFRKAGSISVPLSLVAKST
jgi:hypothetical protein